ncbi:prepilin-type N-terminal cleavage/methylation domain-containing protein [Candidatus Saganbacteria bacterium]|nr:prepilin-type N-terminal cleavage/methylation domain-containing protein [Candidatus Saganbacteria bacterium]
MKERGFTLVEMIIALTLSVLVLSAGTFMLSNYLRTYKKLSSAVEKNQIEQFVLRKVVSDIQFAENINIGSAPGLLVLNLKDDMLRYDYFDQKVRRRANKSTAYLTEAGEISSLSFSYPRPGLVLINLDNAKTGAYCRNEK